MSYFKSKCLPAYDSSPDNNTRFGERQPAEAFLGSSLRIFTNAFLAWGCLPGSRWHSSGARQGSLVNLSLQDTGCASRGKHPSWNVYEKGPEVSYSPDANTPPFKNSASWGEKGACRELKRILLFQVLKGPEHKAVLSEPLKSRCLKRRSAGRFNYSHEGPGPCGAFSSLYMCL